MKLTVRAFAKQISANGKIQSIESNQYNEQRSCGRSSLQQKLEIKQLPSSINITLSNIMNARSTGELTTKR